MNGVIKVTDQLSVGKYIMLGLDTEIPRTSFNAVIIDGKEYEPIIPYDIKNSIAIKATDNFIGKEISFV